MAITLVTRTDRRGRNRLHTPICRTCRTREQVVVTLRSLSRIHFRCVRCGELMAEPNPAATSEPPDDRRLIRR